MIPDPMQVARQEAEKCGHTIKDALRRRLERIVTDCPHIERDSLLAGLTAFHVERMAKIPSREKYPEAQPWVEHVIAVDRELQSITGMSTEHLAMLRSMGKYLTFRGYAGARRVAGTERCRIAFIPDTDLGRVHIKNVDDPLTNWKPDPAMTLPFRLDAPLVWDGVGSGLHIDDEPDEIFPLPINEMCHACCDDVPGAVDFLTRYAPFWGGGNALLRDRQNRSVAIEKTSHNFIEVFYPGPDGRSHISGMVCRNPDSPQAGYVKRKRREYLQRFDLPADGPDQLFWDATLKFEEKLAGFLAKPGQITVDELQTLFLTPWPDGLNKNGLKLHPDQGIVGYTLQTRLLLLDQRKYYRWQRSSEGVYAETPELWEY